MDLQNARVLVVGSTGAVGGAVAARLAEEGARLALTGRRADALAALGERLGAAHTVSLDLIDVDACAAVVARAAEQLGGLDALVVASGVAAFGAGRDEQDAVVEELFAVNTFGPMALARAAIPLLGRGSSITVLTAVLADVPTAGMAAYSASKSATSAYLTALRRELRRDGIAVFDVRPPHMETGLAERALVGEPPRMPRGVDLGEVVELIVQGMAQGSSELVADLRSGTVALR
jgi:NAD(P)-dependent dehydrogenase (short-subunit alcohol dehydrogenase family)